ncbi:MAG: cupin [Thaumarchaeota archaeon]|nr:MAG: cupin [Nitrososphaerota archaeon]
MSGRGSRGYKVVYPHEVEAAELKEEGAEKAWIRWLISKEDGAPNFSMRFFEIEPGGRTPLHEHPWEHEVFILSGEGKVILGDEEKIVGPQAAIYIPPNLRHSFINVGREKLSLLCLIPHRQSD